MQDHSREDEEALLPILLPILLAAGIACWNRPTTDAKTAITPIARIKVG